MRQHTGDCPFPEHERAVIEWFASHKMQVDCSHHDVLNFYTWRYESSEPSTTLQVTDEVLRHFSPRQLAEALESLKVNAHIKGDPHRVARLIQSGDAIGLELFPRLSSNAEYFAEAEDEPQA